ncbi:DUF3106 domain-containing protein [Luteimonas sp. MC1750]|uniref:DUF3106 domain-containing protein n=1 Tax=Luteimonas sp. MC1750 TaxID=2799326 RepID=UPI0018F0AED4|nr:DUF3106 domain-containing protein [Luteimonas sp. MC1750]MBJ6985427.1 DUF3106 domain-containing protein [Luteimonas sp. MC1750]QQO05319.1 DUF3106 domain-containing protein [Luteimonas sp. MC1750]
MPNPTIRSTTTALLLALATFTLPAAAQTPAGPALPAWDQLSDAQREALVAPLRQRWDDHPERRARMLEHAERWQQMPPEQRERARRGAERWRQMDPEKRGALRALYAHMRTLPEAEREVLRKQWGAMTPAQRRAWVQAHPAPPRAPRSPEPPRDR